MPSIPLSNSAATLEAASGLGFPTGTCVSPLSSLSFSEFSCAGQTTAPTAGFIEESAQSGTHDGIR